MTQAVSQQESRATTVIVWPLSLIIAIGVTMTLLAVFTTMDMPQYVHGKGVPRATPWVVVLAYTITVTVWLVIETRSAWYSRTSIDRPRAWFKYHLRRLPLFVLGFIVSGFGLRIAGFVLIGLHVRLTPQFMFGLVFGYESLKAALLYCCWLGLAFGVLSFVQMRQQAEHLLAMQKSMVEAKLSQLQGQLRPHFLFNALNTISALMQVDVVRADRLLSQLGDLLRANLEMSERDVVALNQELALLHLYTEIMHERFAGRVTIEWDVESNVEQASIPAMLLQPLIENSFKHGIEKTTENALIRIQIRRDNAWLRIEIFNTGSVLPAEPREGFGLRNCRERLRLLYGAMASLTLVDDAGGVLAKVSLPWTRSEA